MPAMCNGRAPNSYNPKNAQFPEDGKEGRLCSRARSNQVASQPGKAAASVRLRNHAQSALCHPLLTPLPCARLPLSERRFGRPAKRGRECRHYTGELAQLLGQVLPLITQTLPVDSVLGLPEFGEADDCFGERSKGRFTVLNSGIESQLGRVVVQVMSTDEREDVSIVSDSGVGCSERHGSA